MSDGIPDCIKRDKSNRAPFMDKLVNRELPFWGASPANNPPALFPWELPPSPATS